MRRILLILIGLVVAFVGFQYIRGCLVSEETKIRWRIEEMEEGFDDAKVSPCLRGVADGWRDSRSGVTRVLLADVLRSVFFHERDPKTKRFRYRVELEEEPVIELDSKDTHHASVTIVLRFDTLDGVEWAPTWRVQVEAEMHKYSDHGWQMTRTERETLWSDGRLMSRRF